MSAAHRQDPARRASPDPGTSGSLTPRTSTICLAHISSKPAVAPTSVAPLCLFGAAIPHVVGGVRQTEGLRSPGCAASE